MTSSVLLDAGVVTRCRRRVHLENDPTMLDAPRAAANPAAEHRMADAAAHRSRVGAELAELFGLDWLAIPAGAELSGGNREQLTLDAMRARVPLIWNPQLPRDPVGGRRGRIDLLVGVDDGYLPVLVVRHKITDPGSGARTSPLSNPRPAGASSDRARKVRPQPRDQLRLVHAMEMLRSRGFHAGGRATGGVIGLDADVVLWHDLDARTWPGGRTAVDEYGARFADRLAVATAAAHGAPALAHPSRIMECRSCPWWPVCEADLLAHRDVSLVVRGEDASLLRAAGVRTVDDLAALDPTAMPPATLVSVGYPDAVTLARAWLADLTVVRRNTAVRVPRADIEVDIDMESFGDAGAYLWGCLLTGSTAAIDEPAGYRAFVTWQPLPTPDEGRSFARFWQWLTTVREKARQRGLSFCAYCYNELAENRWLLSSTDRFPTIAGMPSRTVVQEFIDSTEWVDEYRIVSDAFLCARGKGLKTIAPVAGFGWRDAEASGENSMRWYRDAVGLDGAEPTFSQRDRLLAYNEDDVRATHALREWMTSPAIAEIPCVSDL